MSERRCFAGLVALAVVALTATIGCREAETECVESMSDADAVAVAEEYVRQNGYTQAPASTSGLDVLPSEESLDRKTLLSRRRGVLQGRALGFERADRGWRVLFRYTKPMTYEDKEFGRAVLVDDCSGNALLEHESPELVAGSFQPVK